MHLIIQLTTVNCWLHFELIKLLVCLDGTQMLQFSITRICAVVLPNVIVQRSRNMEGHMGMPILVNKRGGDILENNSVRRLRSETGKHNSSTESDK